MSHSLFCSYNQKTGEVSDWYDTLDLPDELFCKVSDKYGFTYVIVSNEHCWVICDGEMYEVDDIPAWCKDIY